MQTQFLPNNLQWQDPKLFLEADPHLSYLKQLKYVNEHALISELPVNTPGIYTLGGGRQIGKTTLLKQWMAKLLSQGVSPKSIAFITGELIDDHHVLLRNIQTLLSDMPTEPLNYLIIDEVTYINGWEKCIKYAADIRLFANTIVILTGSDLMLIKKARMTFPGRRGQAKKINFHLYPLSFREYIELVGEKNLLTTSPDMENLYRHFECYLQHGGFLTAINDMAIHNKILESTLITYAEWICGDMVKHGKSEFYVREIIEALISKYTSQLTWNTLADAISIDHPNTVADYCQLLESMDALFIQFALLEDKLTRAPKKARKLIFTDPFIYHALRYWLKPIDSPFSEQIQPAIKHPDISSQLVEASVVAHYRRHYPTYYIKAAGEIDVAYIDQDKFWPIEVKWRNQLRPKDVKQVSKYKNARIFSKIIEASEIQTIPIEPLPLALLQL